MKSLLIAAGWEPFIPFAIFFGFITLSILHALWKRSQRSGSDESWDRPSESAEPDKDSEGRPVVDRYIRPASLSPPAPGTVSPTPVTTTPRPLSPWEQELERVLGRTAPTVSPPPLPTPAPAVPPPPVVAADWRSANR